MANCIACGEELREVECIGQIKGMQVSFCDADAEMCENCEIITCRTTAG